MKKIISIISAIAMCGTMLVTSVAAAGVTADEEYKWVYNDGTKYLYNQVSETYEKGITWFEGDTWYCDEDGSLICNEWGKDIEGNIYYFGKSGAALTSGLYKLEGDEYFLFNADGYMQVGLKKVGKNYYYFDKSDGHRRTGLVKIGKSYYYFDKKTGKMKSGWVGIDGEKYYFGNNGKMLTGTKLINGVEYTFGADGALIK